MCGSHPFRVLRAKPLWIANGAITGALALLFTLFYVGADEGAAVGGKQVSAGAQVTVSIENSSVSGAKADWKVMDERRVKEELGEGKLLGALVWPDDSTASVAAPIGTTATGTPSRPSVTVLTNQSAGSVGPGLARQATTQAAESPSLQVGKELTVRSGAGQAEMSTAARVPLADPVAVTVKDGHPLDSHSGRGRTAFSYALVLVVCGMLSANVISGQAVHALGRTLAISSTLVIGISLLMGTLVTVGAVGIMGMDAPTCRCCGCARWPPSRSPGSVRSRSSLPSARPACWWSRRSSSAWPCRWPAPSPPSRRCPASTASSRSSNRCGRSPTVSGRSSTTTPRPTPA